MPIYEYVCNDCRTRYEKLVRASGEPIACPHCGSAKSTLQFSVFSAVGKSSLADTAAACDAPVCMRTPRGCACE
jgi:putative FmdB family regulatory protein